MLEPQVPVLNVTVKTAQFVDSLRSLLADTLAPGIPSWRALFKPASKAHTRTTLLGYLFPSGTQPTRLRLQELRHASWSRLKHRAQSRVYRALVAWQSRKQSTRRTLFGSLRRRGIYHLRREAAKDGAVAPRSKMAYTGPASGTGYGGDQASLRSEGSREAGSRRKYLKGVLKSANEMRQSYFSGEGGGRDFSMDESGVDGPGAFPDAAVVRSGNEEMILFPSYGRRHVKSKLENVSGEPSEQEYWRGEWQKHQNDNAIVDVDVRGWIYTPQRGQHTRKQRIIVGLARQLSGIPAPQQTQANNSSSSRASSPVRPLKQDEELINIEAANILNRGKYEQRNAAQGAYSEAPSTATDTDSLYGDGSRETSPARGRQGGSTGHRLSQVSMSSTIDDGEGTITPLRKRSSWAQPSKMNATELAVANAHLLARLRPFMANPLEDTPISAFFYNESASRQHTVYTNDSGHFTCRASLDFVPTHVRILAGEKLSATEEVIITSTHGVSLISDIDDTIKHSAISSGAREIFRNAFIRDLGDLTIDGVREWYTTLHDMGVKMHYVSNSPWQMYPVLTSFFKSARLPNGSFHLKQYTGMLQGIFEPVAERKKSSLDKLMRDFPDRKFMLVGDSGEADLEVYTDVALDNPGRILGIFIRDVTTPVKTGYFDSSASGGNGSGKHSRNTSRDSLAMSKHLSRPDDIRNDDSDLQAAIAASLADMERETAQARRGINPDAPDTDSGRPSLPSRSRTDRPTSIPTYTTSPAEEDLIDFSEVQMPKVGALAVPTRDLPAKGSGGRDSSLSQRSMPSPPPKPSALRTSSPAAATPQTPGSGHKQPPPRPRKPSSTVKPATPQPSQAPQPQVQTTQPSPLSQVSALDSPVVKDRPSLPPRPTTYRGIAKEKLSNAYNALPSASAYWNGDSTAIQGRHSDPPRSMSTRSSASDLRSSNRKSVPPMPPPRRTATSLSLTAARKASNRLSGGWDDESAPSSPGDTGMSKKEYLWRQRWARAQSVLEPQGVTLRTWRTGSDVADVSVRLAEMEIRRIAKRDRDEAQK